jgi:dienelactone hydrolase
MSRYFGLMVAFSLGLILSLASMADAAGGAVTYRIDGQSFEGHYVSPAAEAPLVLLIHDWDGLTAYEIRRAQMLADAGYAVFAADLFGAGVRPAAIEERRRLTGELYQDRGKMRKRMAGALAAARAQGARVDNAVAVGYCFGGAAVLELARSGANLKGFVSFHGGLDTPAGQHYADTRGQILVLHGTADEAVSMESFAALAKEMASAGVVHEMITYSGAPHAFTVFGSERYRKDADEKSWSRFLVFLDDLLK